MSIARTAGDFAPVDQRSVRRHNLRLVLREVARDDPQTRAQIATRTGLNKTTVSSLVAELVELALLRELEPEVSGAVGRPGVRLELSGDVVAALGLEVNVDSLSACATDLAGRVRHRAFVPRDNRGRPAEQVVDELATLAHGVLDVLASQGLAPAGATVALPGLVDLSQETLLVAPNLGWTDEPVARLLTERLGDRVSPIRVANDADLAALGELWEGLGQRLSDFILIAGAVGIGGGVITDGELRRGVNGFAGEVGHLQVNSQGPGCVCGSVGCLELYAGQDALLSRIGMVPPPAADEAGRWSALVAARARSGDPQVLAALEEVAGWLAIGLVTAANVLDPAAIVLGGFFAPLGEWIAPRVQREIDARVLGAGWSNCQVLLARLGEDASVRGAAALVLHEVLADPGSVRRLQGRTGDPTALADAGGA